MMTKRRGGQRSVAPFLFLALALAAIASDDAAPYLRRAEERRLWEDPAWLDLLHYRDPWHGGPRSQIDDPVFFLADDGKTNPRAELIATLEALFAAPDEDPLDHAACRFIGRTTWLRRELQIPGDALPVAACQPFDAVMAQLKPVSATLVFPAAYMNSPASLFGHTLLVIDGEDENRLLAKSINYGAITGERFGPLFALRGILGRYKGYYAIEPYYDMVEKYNDINHRDVWEYTLDFAADELDRLLRHTWELQNVYSRYFFSSENCSYNLLWLLEAARPELNIIDAFPRSTIPVDTIKAVTSRGLVRDVAYRPSKVSELRYLASLAGDEERDVALALSGGAMAPAELGERIEDPDRQMLVLSLAANYTQYQYAQRSLPRHVYTTRFLPLLKARSRLGSPAVPRPDPPEPDRPESGHASGRCGVGGGARNGEGFVTLHYRPAYHERIDPERGFDAGAQIQFLDTELRYDPGEDDLQLERWSLVDVFSIAPRDALFDPYSWRVKAGLQQQDRRDGEDRLVGVARTATGVAYHRRDFLLAGFVDTEAQVSGSYDDGAVAGMGPSFQVIAPTLRGWKSVFEAEALWFGLPDDLWRFVGAWDHLWRLSDARAARLRLRHETWGGYHANEVGGALVWYF